MYVYTRSWLSITATASPPPSSGMPCVFPHCTFVTSKAHQYGCNYSPVATQQVCSLALTCADHLIVQVQALVPQLEL
ncbi:hypothetical protein KQX54_018974 [Cotesia glomerata]|uniref:Secreted protein n=1 Tax=Cotesia glomerata TaxID=32391 RepID=A0AAV7HYV4_COTGL|nr:hypothetical protein KQX54_018974 [Cotesia glomerata]